MRIMKILRDLPVRRKIALIILCVSIIALFFASGFFMIYDRISFLEDREKEMWVTAKIFSSNTTAAIALNDVKSANETLSALKFDDHILAATIYDKAGQEFTGYKRNKFAEIHLCTACHEKIPENSDISKPHELASPVFQDEMSRFGSTTIYCGES